MIHDTKPEDRELAGGSRCAFGVAVVRADKKSGKNWFIRYPFSQYFEEHADGPFRGKCLGKKELESFVPAHGMEEDNQDLIVRHGQLLFDDLRGHSQTELHGVLVEDAFCPLNPELPADVKQVLRDWQKEEVIRDLEKKNKDGTPAIPAIREVERMKQLHANVKKNVKGQSKNKISPKDLRVLEEAAAMSRGFLRAVGPPPAQVLWATFELPYKVLSKSTAEGKAHFEKYQSYNDFTETFEYLRGKYDWLPEELKQPSKPEHLKQLTGLLAIEAWKQLRSKHRSHAVTISMELSRQTWMGERFYHISMIWVGDWPDGKKNTERASSIVEDVGIRFKPVAGKALILCPKEYPELLVIFLYQLKWPPSYRNEAPYSDWLLAYTEASIPITPFFQVFTCIGKVVMDVRRYPPPPGRGKAHNRPSYNQQEGDPSGARMSQGMLSQLDASDDTDASEDADASDGGVVHLSEASLPHADFEEAVVKEFSQPDGKKRKRHSSDKKKKKKKKRAENK
ncbi:MAG: hypothetical protein SGILL_008524 [Bacillariaceae sp.]